MNATLISAAAETHRNSREEKPPSRGRDLGGVVGLVMAIIGTVIGAQALSDNSFLTHLATGRETIANGFVRSDVFTWTSQGQDLVVQSWLASLLYGVVEDAVGLGGVRLLMAATAGSLAWIAWRLSSTAASLSTRVLIMVPVLMVGGATWTERPLLLALVLFGVTMLIADGWGRPSTLVLVGAAWVGVHGSWPLGVVLLLAMMFGAWLDGANHRRELDSVKWLTVGTLFGGVINPYGPALLLFPLDLLGRRDILGHVAEWAAPSFGTPYEWAFLVLILMSVVAIARRSSWRTLVPMLIFVAAALVSRRNIPLAVLVMIPVVAAGLPAVGRLASTERSRAIRIAGRVLSVVLVVLPLSIIGSPHLDLDRYPGEAIDHLEAIGMSPTEVRAIHPDFVGNYLDLRYGSTGASWIDDRYELHDPALVADYLVLYGGSAEWSGVLDRSGGDVMIWQSDAPITTLVRDVAGWTQIWSDDEWTVLCRPGSRNC